MHKPLMSMFIDGVRSEVPVQHISMRMQNQPEVTAERLKAHLFDHIERMATVLGAALHDRMLQIAIGVQQLIVAQILLQLRWCL